MNAIRIKVPRLSLLKLSTVLPLLVMGLVVLACAPPPAETPVTEPAAAPTATANPEEVAIRQAWKSGPHADTYDLGKGPNTYCARCHSPKTWDPAAAIDPPPNCVSCKFPTDQEVRIATGNPLVTEQDWQHIGCESCHLVLQGEVQPDLGWLDVQTGFHETIGSATELCEKCHTNTETLRHRRELGEQAHADFSCVDCHDPHSTSASCTTSGCHPDQEDRTAEIPGHDPAHAAVACVACHDASGLAAAPIEGGTAWVTWRTTALLGRETEKIYQSHTLQREVDCTRCHHPDNSWGLEAPTGGEQQP